jgi:hypothetical protein
MPVQMPQETIVMYVREPELARLAPATGTYHGRFQVRLLHHRIEGVLPLRSGAAYQRGADIVRIEGLERTPGHVSLLVRRSGATSSFDREPSSETNYYLRNLKAGEATFGGQRGLQVGATIFRLLPFVAIGSESGGFKARGFVIQFPLYASNADWLSLTDDWINGAELVVVKTTREGFVERALEIADFPVRDSARSPSSTASFAPGR